MFRLALALGYTVAELEARLGAHELGEWIAYSRLEPFGQWRADRPVAILSALMANINRDPKKSKSYEPDDFMAVPPVVPPGQLSAGDRRAIGALKALKG